MKSLLCIFFLILSVNCFSQITLGMSKDDVSRIYPSLRIKDMKFDDRSRTWTITYMNSSDLMEMVYVDDWRCYMVCTVYPANSIALSKTISFLDQSCNKLSHFYWTTGVNPPMYVKIITTSFEGTDMWFLMKSSEPIPNED